jgi:hypothetical protein
MSSQTTYVQPADLYLIADLERAGRTSKLADRDLHALRAVADWITSFAVKPHKDLGRTGPVCPFVPRSLERKTLWLALEHVADRSTHDLVELIEGYKSQFLHAQPTSGDDAIFKSIVIVLADLSPARAKEFFSDILEHVAAPSYVDDGLVLGGFYEGNEGTAIYNRSFRPFTSPVPFLLMRSAVISDWKFFLDNEEWLKYWARRFGATAVQALAEELRRLPWRTT